LLRALSFVRATGKSITGYRSGAKKLRPFRIIQVAIDLPRETLYAQINRRVDQMMAAGLLDEVKSLTPYRQYKALQTVGYAELFDYLDGRCSLEEAVDKIRQHTRNYAKRQITWLRREQHVHWLSPDAASAETILQTIATIRDRTG
jgi:tRNA dimethylallyltransferase